MVYGLLEIYWVIVGIAKDDLWAWDEICIKKKFLDLTSFNFFRIVWKEMNNRAFEGCEREMARIRDRRKHVLGSLILNHDIYRWEDLGMSLIY